MQPDSCAWWNVLTKTNMFLILSQTNKAIYCWNARCRVASSMILIMCITIWITFASYYNRCIRVCQTWINMLSSTNMTTVTVVIGKSFQVLLPWAMCTMRQTIWSFPRMASSMPLSSGVSICMISSIVWQCRAFVPIRIRLQFRMLLYHVHGWIATAVWVTVDIHQALPWCRPKSIE